MALSRMYKLSDLCCTKTVSLLRPQNTNKFNKHVRNFRQARNNTEEIKVKTTESFSTPFANAAEECGQMRPSNLLKPLVFTIGFSTVSFGSAAIWEYENMRSHAISMVKKPIKFFKRKTEQFSEKSNVVTKEVKKWWNGLSPGERVFVPLCAINVVVFLAWRVPSFQPFMLKYFCSNPGAKNVCLPMILSTFSHYSGFHLLANMYVLHSFSSGAVHALGQEQFLGLYMTSGVVSSFTSYVYKVMTKQPGLSLGASGAIMAILGYVCTQYPETRLGIIFFPFFTFSAGAAIKFIVGLDTAGVLLGWKFFDHAAHLGGAACGIAWAYWGNQFIWQKREPLLQYWHELRGSIK